LASFHIDNQVEQLLGCATQVTGRGSDDTGEIWKYSNDRALQRTVR